MRTDIVSSTLKTLSKSLGALEFPIAVFKVENETLSLISVSNIPGEVTQENLPKSISVNTEYFNDFFEDKIKIDSVSTKTNIPEIFNFATQIGAENLSLIKIESQGKIQGVLLIGGNGVHKLTKTALQPYINSARLVTTIFNQANLIEEISKSSSDSISGSDKTQAIGSFEDISVVFNSLHEQVKILLNHDDFTIAFYDENKQTISIPFMVEDGVTRSIDPFPLGKGLASIIIRTKKPLLLENQEQIEKSGAKRIGAPSKSWMGVPLIIDTHVVGALFLQDSKNENAFRKSDLSEFEKFAQKIAWFLQNARSFDSLKRRLSQVQVAAKIARDISSALDLNELLLRAVNLIRDRFNFYHAAVFLIDPLSNNAIVREATGDAGIKMKREAHKLAVGSKSTVGYVAGQGEALVVNDISKDATHKLNPLLPDTQAEAAIPLKIGDRILGVLDVQSTIPYSFSTNDIETFQILADQLAIAVNNSELFAETQEHLSQHRLLHHITTSAASGTTLEEALSSTVNGLQVTLGGDRVAILLSDSDHKNLLTKAWVGYSEESTAVSIPFGDGITGWVAEHRKTLRIEDVTQDSRYIKVSPNTKSELAIPLIFRNDILGVINVESEQVGAYTKNDEEMLGTLAGSLAAIIANARLIEQIRKQADRERQLNEITSKIRHSTDMRTIISTTVNELIRATGAQNVQIEIGTFQSDD
ncbi:MAG: GAF domain-containing protein [Anaerolineae bacterium]|nr:GAF domain-containing protein [Anaerolineae bacterium]